MLTISTQIAREDNLTTFESMLKSVKFADEIIVFNLERTDDDALELFRKYAVKVVQSKTPKIKIVEEIRDLEVKAAKGDWVLVLDFDEVIPLGLKDEILAIVESNAACSSYSIPRDNYSLGYRLNHGGWERDYVVRLIRKADFVSWPKNIHSTPVVKGSTVKTIHAMEHHKDSDLSQMVAKTNRYSDIEAQLFYDGGLPFVTVLTLLRKWWMESLRRGVLKRGILDGKIGLIQSLYQGFSVFISYAKLYEKQIKRI